MIKCDYKHCIAEIDNGVCGIKGNPKDSDCEKFVYLPPLDKKRSDKYIYIYSHILRMEVATHKETGRTFMEDGTIYTKQEIEAIDGNITIQIHNTKKVFKGVVDNPCNTD